MKTRFCFALAILLMTGCSQPPSPPASTPSKAPTAAASASAKPTATPSATASSSATPSATPSASGSPTAGKGEEVVREEVGVKYTIPAGWKKAKPDGTVLTSADESLVVVFIEADEDDIKEVLKNIGKKLEKVIQDPKVEKEESEHEINGMKSFTLSGTGKLGGKDAEWSVEVLAVKKPLIIVEFALKGAYEKNKAAYDEFENSFQAVEGGKGGAKEEE